MFRTRKVKLVTHRASAGGRGGSRSAVIDRDGMVLMERPKAITDTAAADEYVALIEERGRLQVVEAS